MIISHAVLLRMRNVSGKSCRENQKAHFMFSNFFFFLNFAVYEIMWKNILKPDRPQMTVWRIRIACCLTKAADTPSHYVILTAFPRQQMLHERASSVHFLSCWCLGFEVGDGSFRFLKSTIFRLMGVVECWFKIQVLQLSRFWKQELFHLKMCFS